MTGDYLDVTEHTLARRIQQADADAVWQPDEADACGPVQHHGPREWADYWTYYRARGLDHASAAEAAVEAQRQQTRPRVRAFRVR